MENIQRSHGVWAESDLSYFLELVKDIKGDIAEVGVWKGDTFRKLLKLSGKYSKKCHAFDSFEGMAEPGENDDNHYFKGKFDIGGVNEFKNIFSNEGFDLNSFSTYEGFVPDCFRTWPSDKALSFVIIDLDHYKPTVDAMGWAWRHLSVGGIMALDDFVTSHNHHATLAIKEFLRDQVNYHFVNYFNQQLFLKKTMT